MRACGLFMLVACLCGCTGESAGPPLQLDDPRRLGEAWLLERLDLPPADRPLEARLRQSLGSADPVRCLPFEVVGRVTDGAVVLETGPLPLDRLTDWSQPDQGNRFHTVLHALDHVMVLQRHFEQTGHPRYRELAHAVLLDWIDRNPLAAPAHPRAWFEGTVSKRMLALIRLADSQRRRPAPGPVSLTLLLTMIHQHAQFLSQPAVYKPCGNHGMRQDLALLAAAAAVPQFKDAAAWRATALARLRDQQVKPGFTADGVWREHSPGYHLYVMKLMRSARALLAGRPEAAFLDDLDQRSQHYLTHVLDPSGVLPPIGDTYYDAFPREYLEDLMTTPSARYAFTQGRQGTAPAELDGHFPATGQVVMRDRWRDPARGCYVHLHAERHPRFGHRQADDLSFVLHGLGRWWIIDGGRHSSEDCPEHHHLSSVFAHNGYTFKGDALAARQPGGEVYVDRRLVSTPALAAARAVTTRFTQPARVTRTLVFLRQRKTLVVVDRLQSDRPGQWQNRLHLAADLQVDLAAGRAFAVGGPHRLEIVTADAASIHMEKGQTAPLRGWYAPGPGRFEPTPTLVFTRHGNDLMPVTLIRLAERNAPVVGSLAVGPAGVIEWSEGTERVRLQVHHGEQGDLATLLTE